MRAVVATKEGVLLIEVVLLLVVKTTTVARLLVSTVSQARTLTTDIAT